MSELKPCPFCKGEHVGVIGSYSLHWAKCHECKAEGPTSPTREGAVVAWNTRAERTCEITVDDKTAINCTLFWCSYCKTPSEVWFSYCPNCGAKVVSE